MNFMDKFKDISYPLFIISTFILPGYSVQFKEKKCMLIELKMQSFSLLGVRKEIVIMGVIKVWYVWQIKISITAQHSPYRNNF